MIWTIDYVDVVTAWLDKLTKEQLKSVAKELRLLELSGNTLRLPHSRSLSNGLYELRERRFGLRLYYCFHTKQTVLLLYKARTLLKQVKG